MQSQFVDSRYRGQQFVEAIIAMPEVLSCHMVSGDSDYLLEVVVPDREHYQMFLVEKLLDFPMIKEVRSTIAIQSLKTSASLPLAHLT
jgi:Lrp/AsnC family leucine-responsive transcriptional regulator